MFRFTRTATVKAGGALAAALCHGAAVAAYLNGKHDLGMRFGPDLWVESSIKDTLCQLVV